MLWSSSAGAQSALFALLAALLWGGGDFSGGVGVKALGGTVRGALRIIVAAHAVSLLVLAGCLWFIHAAWPATEPLLWGLGAGIAGALGILMFYIALSNGAMGASAAISGLLAAAIPAAVSSVLEGSPGPMRLGGFALAAVAIWCIAAAPAEAGVRDPSAFEVADRASHLRHDRRLFALAIGGGIGFGLYFVALRFANAAGVIEPMVMARFASVTLCLLLLLVLGKNLAATSAGETPPVRNAGAPARMFLGVPKQAWPWVLGVAVLDTGGNMMFVEATRHGRLDAAAVLASLYPASTILLARVLLHERLSRQQGFGMALALVAVVLVTH